jgi:meso-butanediol dehydrogenase/(S,S)-butanediol dehydrogenase/diacetyl reductase
MALEKTVAIVTGGGRGIGRAIAERLAAEGAAVAVNALHQESAEDATRAIRARGGRAIAVPADVADPVAVTQMVESVAAEFGTPNLMVANAGIVQVRPFLEISPEDLAEVLRVNVHGFVNCAQAAARAMIAAGIPGKIIGASSISGRQGYAFMGHYSATKFAIIGLVQTAAKELAQHGITVNAYVAGMVETDMATTIGDGVGAIFGIPASAAIAEFVKTITLGRMQRPEEVAGLVAYLASPDADYMTGQAVAIDGGITFV